MHSHREAWPQVLVQVNIFNCARIAIGTCSLHTILHAICRGPKEEVAFPDLRSASFYFSPFNDLSLHDHVDKNNEDSSAKKCAPLQGLCLVLNQSTLQELQAKDGDYDERSKQMFVDLQNG